MDTWNRALQLIEDRLTEEIDTRDLARVTLTSEYHFRRMFSALAGIPLSDYIRRRRLTVAAAEVLEGDTPIQDTAVRFGYGSADAFSRAFRSVHGIGPSEARSSGAALKSQPRLRITLSIEGAEQMDYRLETRPAFTLVGRSKRMSVVYHGENAQMTQFHDDLGEATHKVIWGHSTTQPEGIVAVSTNFEEGREDGSKFDYWVAAAAEEAPSGESLAEHGLETMDVESGTWLVLTSKDAETASIQQLWVDAYGAWFPANPYEVAEGPELCVVRYDEDWTPTHADLWLPIRKA
ncbi:helix-turn-helix domain-containing protein [uncultured Agrococcus sp.]|uniref:AraC family transcriptional regulator n=1 Tax=uncultured Agrococcus sp. TaxID=382258 RepID=UPI0025EC4D03|nr:helix-turn-helix domain-containing protein [uncultured Agrococcus sp.]